MTVYTRILSLQATAQRLANRVAVTKEFENLPIEVTGIRWTPRGSAALINETIVEPGMILAVGESRLQVETIEEDAVIFIFKGQRFRRRIVGREPIE